MSRIVVDIEAKTTKVERGGHKWTDMSPFHPDNFLVSVGLKDIDTGEKEYLYFKHKDFKPEPGEVERNLQRVNWWFSKAKVIVGSNLKYDLNWLGEANVKLPSHRKVEYFCTQIAECVLAKGDTTIPFGVDAIAARRGLPRKKPFNWDKTIDLVDIDIVTEYGEGDLDTSAAVYLDQLERLNEPQNMSMKPALKLMNDFCFVLSKWERRGFKISREALADVRREFEQEYRDVEKFILKTAKERLGDTPFNINSNDDLSMLIYSRVPTSKKSWSEIFNLGTDEKGKKKRRKHYKAEEFLKIVQKKTKVIRKTIMNQCPDCLGHRYQTGLKKKDGTPSKRKLKCTTCDAKGVVYTDTDETAGFKRMPKNAYDTATHGFATNKEKMEHFASICKDPEEKKFFEAIVRYNKLSTYLNTFVTAIERFAYPENDMLHTQLNQTIAATNRLTSSNPNFQNQPRGTTFPVRKVVVSRFPFGKILKVDYAQLEFRIAAALSECPVALKDILDKVDVHRRSASIILKKDQDKVTKGERQEPGKPNTFKPLYGGTQGTKDEKRYFEWFIQHYTGIAKWHHKLKKLALSKQPIELPSGRQYYFKGTYRQSDKWITNQTKIVNYPVQGFATADIVPLACILVEEAFEDNPKLKSVPFLQVHDEVDVDVYPGEEKKATKLVCDAMLSVREALIERFGYTLKVPLEVEATLGDNWMDGETVMVKELPYQPWEGDFHDDPLDDIGNNI